MVPGLAELFVVELVALIVATVGLELVVDAPVLVLVVVVKVRVLVVLLVVDVLVLVLLVVVVDVLVIGVLEPLRCRITRYTIRFLPRLCGLSQNSL